MLRALCVNCGYAKARPSERCKACRFDPTTDDGALVRSVYLSVGRVDDPDARAALSEELSVLQKDIRAGRPVEFDPTELARLADQLRRVRSVSWRAVWVTLIRFFAPGILVLAVVGAALWLLRRITTESHTAVRRAECVVQLTHVGPNADPLPPPCLALSSSDRKHAQGEAHCVSLRQRATAKGLDPDSACRFQVKPSP